MALKGLFFCQGKLYKKDPKTQFRCTCLGDYTYLIQNVNKVIRELVEMFPQTLSNITLFSLLSNVTQIESSIKCNVDDKLISHKVENNVMEFKDGLYFLEYGTFVRTELLAENFKQHIKCLRYYDKPYLTSLGQTSRLKPKRWLKHIETQVKNAQNFCIELGKSLCEGAPFSEETALLSNASTIKQEEAKIIIWCTRLYQLHKGNRKLLRLSLAQSKYLCKEEAEQPNGVLLFPGLWMVNLKLQQRINKAK